MSAEEQWAANQKFLDRMIARGDEIILSTSLDKVMAGSYFARELTPRIVALAPGGLPQPFELFGTRVTPCLAPQRLTPGL